MYPFRNLVFEGGGVKGIAYVGAMQELDKESILGQIERVGGTSAGAINALLLGLGYSIDETREILENLTFTNFLDDEWGVLRDVDRIFKEYGFYKGDFFRAWVAERIKHKAGKADATFLDLKKKGLRDMYFVGTNLSTGFAEVFSAEHTPRMCVADAVRISMSIPLFFASIRNVRRDVYVDGGLLDNYPIKLFDREKFIDDIDKPAHARETDYYLRENQRMITSGVQASRYVYNRETLGFRLDSREEIALYRDQSEPVHHPIQSIVDYAVRLVDTILETQANVHLHSDDWQRTVYIDTLGVKTTDFALSDATKRKLVTSGQDGTRAYLNWFRDPQQKVVNRPATAPAVS